ncbi:hypothetical protein [Maribellus sp. YY47]|uniref:hypothetical protein n=1 Tax=Maribellus sp. YY47 TaxID=2929486 RepID=UPI00200191C2|nr:hypothetical protein [Maribellus sp. YY47]MCK3683250.1 hypothetical protein [Maribellus sp. YY47]
MKKLYFILLILGLAIVSCDQDNIGEIYKPEAPYVAFASSVVPQNFLSADNDYSVMVQIVRSDLSGSTTANISLEMNDDIEGVFDLESATVTFTDGQAKAYAKIVPVIPTDQINPAKMYKFKLTLTGDNVSELYNTTTYTALFNIEYQDAGTGDFNSDFWPGAWPVDLLKADLGNDLIVYKAIDLYEEGYDIVIVVSGGNVTVSGQAAWYYDDDYGDVFVSGTGTVSGKVLTLKLTHYIPDVYAWDEATETLTLP